MTQKAVRTWTLKPTLSDLSVLHISEPRLAKHERVLVNDLDLEALRELLERLLSATVHSNPSLECPGCQARAILDSLPKP